jgi:hypothetical protein
MPLSLRRVERLTMLVKARKDPENMDTFVVNRIYSLVKITRRFPSAYRSRQGETPQTRQNLLIFGKPYEGR